MIWRSRSLAVKWGSAKASLPPDSTWAAHGKHSQSATFSNHTHHHGLFHHHHHHHCNMNMPKQYFFETFYAWILSFHRFGDKPLFPVKVSKASHVMTKWSCEGTKAREATQTLVYANVRSPWTCALINKKPIEGQDGLSTDRRQYIK